MDCSCRLFICLLLISLSACNGEQNKTQIQPTSTEQAEQAPIQQGESEITSPNGSYSISGVISIQGNMLVDSDTNDIRATWKSNNIQPQMLSAPPIQLVGYLNVADQGAAGQQQQQGDLWDRFQISALGGERITLDIPNTSTIDDTNPNRPNLDLYLLDQDNQLIAASISKSGADETLLIPDLPGIYNIEVRLYQDARYPGLFDPKTTYKLTVGDHSANIFDTNTGWSTSDNFIIGDIIVREKQHCENGQSKQDNIRQKAEKFHYKTGNGQVSLYRFGSYIIDFVETEIGRQSSYNLASITQNKSSVVNLKVATLMLAKELNNYPCVEYAEPNYLRQSQLIPNDNLYQKHWQFAKISLPQAWDITTGSQHIKIAVIDSGIISAHPDFSDRLSDDGYDFIRNLNASGDGDGIDSNPEDIGDGVDSPDCVTDNANRPSSFHGTNVAGILGASTNNGVGIAGIDWHAKIMPLRVLGCMGASDYSIAHAIRYAVGLENLSDIKLADPADIINLSLGSPAQSQTLADAIADATDAGTIIIAAAGNMASDIPWYPAAFPQVISVAATDANNQKAEFSNYGGYIDVAAPGVAIWSTGGSYQQAVIVPEYNAYQGTSIATPHISGIAGLMKSVYSTMSPDEFEAILISGNITDDLGETGRDDYFGAGLINAQKALEYAKQVNEGQVSVPITPILRVDQSYINFGSNHSAVTVQAANIGSKHSVLTISDISSSKDYISVTQSNNPDASDQYQIRIDRRGLLPNTYEGSVRFSSNGGQKNISLAFSVTDPNKKRYGNAGNLTLHLTNIDTQEITKLYIASPIDGQYHFEFADIDAGHYLLMAGNDLDNNGVLCEAAESCATFGTQTQPIKIVGKVEGIDLRLEY
jgi:serine protease